MTFFKTVNTIVVQR